MKHNKDFRHDAELLLRGELDRPFSLLGPHPLKKGVAVRTFQPYGARVVLIDGERRLPMRRIHSDGLFEVFCRKGIRSYRLAVTDSTQHSWEIADPYAYSAQLPADALRRFCGGIEPAAYRFLGSHPMVIDDTPGVRFAVWAPRAGRVSVIGDFNRWNGNHHPLQRDPEYGIWSLFVPGLQPGDLYKFEVLGIDGKITARADPFGVYSEIRPSNASVVWEPLEYVWGDKSWLDDRAGRSLLDRPFSVYEMHAGSWRRDNEGRFIGYRELADKLPPYLLENGFTHVELLPLAEHPFDPSWGYQTLGYFAPTSRFGPPQDLMAFVDCCHRHGLGVIMDWVPSHFPRDEHGLARFDGDALYEYSDPRRGEHQDWGTLVFDYGRPEVRNFLLSSASFWADRYHADGLRVDAVASMLYLDYSRRDGQWVPNCYGGRENLEAVDFLKVFNEHMHGEFPGFVTCAEESTDWPLVSRPTYDGGLGFTFKWNLGWMHDILAFMQQDPLHRMHHHDKLTFSMHYAFNENFILPFSHDEVVHGKRSMLAKMPGDRWQKFANLRMLYAYMFAHPGKKLIFMGAELGAWKEWQVDSQLDWRLLDYPEHRGLQRCFRDLNTFYRATPALFELDFAPEGFEWLECDNAAHNILAFIRWSRGRRQHTVCILNAKPVAHFDYRVGTPDAGFYRELFNSDAELYGGGNVGNKGGLHTDNEAAHGYRQSISLTLPPLAMLFLQHDRGGI